MDGDERAAAVFGEWFERHCRGDSCAPEELLAAHPDLADVLRRRIAALALVEDAVGSARAPESIGPFRIVRCLGTGGMGSVYLAEAQECTRGFEAGTRVALKVLHPHLLERPGFFRRFLREAELGRAVVHGNVVRTHLADALSVGGVTHHFLVMEYVEGQTLAELLDEMARVPEELCRHIGREIARGLAAIHAAGAVHRDLKPENVIIARGAAARDDDVAERTEGAASSGRVAREGNVRPPMDHVVKVMDLGVAHLSEEALRLSQTGAFVGSLAYAAPEQFGGAEVAVDGRADLYALGVLLYEIAGGRHPFDDDDARVVMRRVISETPRPLGEINPQLSPFYEELVRRLLAKSPDDRFRSADEVLRALEDGEDSDWWHGRAAELRRASRRPLRRVRIPRETAVYGREGDLAHLGHLFAAARAGDGRVLLLQGEAGIGKTRLLDELVARLEAEGVELDFLFGGYPPAGAATSSGAFSTCFREHLGVELLEERAAELLTATPVLVPAFAALLRGEPPPEGAQPLTQESVRTVFVHAMRALAAERPIVIVIDDLHFAPEEGRALFASLAHAIPGHRVLLVGTARPGLPEDWAAQLERLEHVERRTLARLGVKDMVALLRDSFRSERLAEELAGRIGVKSDGNPFFVFEIIRGLREGQFIRRREDGTWESTRLIGEIDVPSSVMDLVNARVADLAADDRDILDVAACWGHEFDPALVSDVTGIARIPLYKQLAQIERAHRLVRSSGRHFVFDHHQVQEALYASLPEVLREEYHAALAEALETRTKAAGKDPEELDGALCVDLCEHYLKGARGESALRYLAAAQTHLQSGYLNAQVISLSERALAAPDLLTGAERARLLLRLARSLDLVGRRARQEECVQEIERLVEESGNAELRVRAATARGWFSYRSTRYAEAEAAHRRALDIALTSADKEAEAAAMVRLGLVCASQGRLPEAQDHYARALTLGRELGDRGLEATVIGNQGVVLQHLGRLVEAQEHHERHLALSRELGDREGEARAMANLGVACEAQGRLEEALTYALRHLALAHAIGDRGGEVIAMVNVGSVHWSRGRLGEAQEYQERCVALCREIGDRRVEIRATGILGLVFGVQGRLLDAQERFERAITLCQEIGDPLGEVNCLANLGCVHQALGRLSDAQERFERQLVLGREIGDRQKEASAHLNLAGVARERGESEASEQHLLAGLALCEEIGKRRLEASTRLALGSLLAASGDGPRALELLAAARDLARELASPGDEVKSRCELACLPGGDAADAYSAYSENEERLSAEDRREARLLLWKATGDRAHLEEAKRLLDEALAKVPAEYREAMVGGFRVHREILEAWSAGSATDDDELRWNESETRAG